MFPYLRKIEPTKKKDKRPKYVLKKLLDYPRGESASTRYDKLRKAEQYAKEYGLELPDWFASQKTKVAQELLQFYVAVYDEIKPV